MSYSCYLGGMEVPTPAKLTVKVKGKNKTLILLNEGEINFLRSPGLTEITVPLLLPMLGGSRSPSAYLDMLEGLKTGKGTTQFMPALYVPRGGAGRSDQRERKSHAVRRVRLDAERPVRGLGEPQQAQGDIENDIALHCLHDL